MDFPRTSVLSPSSENRFPGLPRTLLTSRRVASLTGAVERSGRGIRMVKPSSSAAMTALLERLTWLLDAGTSEGTNVQPLLCLERLRPRSQRSR